MYSMVIECSVNAHILVTQWSQNGQSSATIKFKILKIKARKTTDNELTDKVSSP